MTEDDAILQVYGMYSICHASQLLRCCANDFWRFRSTVLGTLHAMIKGEHKLAALWDRVWDKGVSQPLTIYERWCVQLLTFLGHPCSLAVVWKLLVLHDPLHRNWGMSSPLYFPLLRAFHPPQHKDRGILWLRVPWTPIAQGPQFTIPTFISSATFVSSATFFPLLHPHLIAQIHWWVNWEYFLGIYFTSVTFVCAYSLFSDWQGWASSPSPCWDAGSSLVWCTNGKENCHGEPAEGSAVTGGNWAIYCAMSFQGVHWGCSCTIFVHTETFQSGSPLSLSSRTGVYLSSFLLHGICSERLCWCMESWG